jgi:cobyrinic acid a,c-diamide synthase
MKNFHACLIAGTHSGAGKTTIMFALEALAKQKGLTVQPFKGGPDYIDPGFHQQASGRACRNLDLFLLSPETVKQSFAKNSQDADLSLIEGMMGLFDGKNAEGEGSSAQIAKLLDLPVILVLDGAGMAGSAAAVVLGFQTFDPSVHLAGIIFNRVNTGGHFQYLKRAVESRTGIPCLGYLPKDQALAIPERHLGLAPGAAETQITLAAKSLEPHLDWNKFLEVTQIKRCQAPSLAPFGVRENFRVVVARDEAFSFYYEDNFDLLREAGAELCFFSPLMDSKLPENLDLLYFGGGFPELYAERLAANLPMLESVRSFEGKIYAECGGLMYLAESFGEHALAGLIPGKIKMAERLQRFGYKELEAARDTFLFPKGKKLRSHEFHHSVWEGEDRHASVYKVGGRLEGFATDRILASYQHLHFGSDPELLDYLIKGRVSV